MSTSFMLIFASVIIESLVTCDVFKLGYLTGSQRKSGDQKYSRPGLAISGAINLAVHEINSYSPLIGNHTLAFVVGETYGDESVSIRETARLWLEHKVSAYIGPQETCIHEARMAASFNLPMISYFCAYPETSNKALFSTFARTRPPDTQISKSVVSVLLKFKWRKIALLYSKSETSFRNFEAVARTIENTLVSYKIQVVFKEKWTTTYHYGFTQNPFRDLIDKSYTHTRIYVIVGHYSEHLGFMLSLEEKGLLKDGNYFVVGVDIEQYDNSHPQMYFKGLLRSEVEEVAEKAFQSYISIVPSASLNYHDFAVKVNKFMQLSPFNFANPFETIGGLLRRFHYFAKIPEEGAFLYDAVYIYARALNDTLRSEKNPFDGRTIFSYIKGRPYKSAMGYMVFMDENGDAEGNYTLITRKKRHGENSMSGLYPVGIFEMPANSSHLPVLNLFDSIDWINGLPPSDEPICGFDGQKCEATPPKWLLVSIGAIILVISIYFAFALRNWAYERELDSLLWRVDYKDVMTDDIHPNGKLSKLRHCSQVSLTSESDLKEFRYCNLYTTVGIYKGRLVAIKKIDKKHVEINRKLKKEMKIMRDIRHDNLNQFIGACVDSPNVCLLSDYCSRGSLQDVLENEEVRLDYIFVASMVSDIIRGMIHLHESSIIYHGNLKSSNCLVDSRWVVKITDFGLREIKSGMVSGEDIIFLESEYEKLLWKAPEILRDHNSNKGSQKGDVYSFGIILYEILGRRGPWGPTHLLPSEIIKRVINVTNNFEPFRPPLSIFYDESVKTTISPVPECCIQCLTNCWCENPEERMDFKTLRNKLRPMRKDLKSNILDNMLEMMERYTNNLEALVDERTDQVYEEKKKTEALLYEMLPKTVADELRRGHKVEAESYDAVTIFFSDVVGFTQMSAQSTPLEIVNFLNDLYTLFDSILESYDVYKVETIGDSYMVASGLPVRNGNLHAAEIASMALHLLHAIRSFRVRHRPHEMLLMRIGIHTGPVCAGVVGLKMPRYCLFGDTVNTASRMESSGVPLKIHCSEQFKKVLDTFGDYETVERGYIPIKGKGEMKTFWLIGETEKRQSRRRIVNESSVKNKTSGIFPLKQIADSCSRNGANDMWRKPSACGVIRSSSTGRNENRHRNVALLSKASSTRSNFIDKCRDNLLCELRPCNSQASLNLSVNNTSLALSYKTAEERHAFSGTISQISVNIVSSERKSSSSLSKKLKTPLQEALLNRVASFPT
ncbi:guanylate cyclase 32E-like protein, partial [Dinothrombium tinctorium]